MAKKAKTKLKKSKPKGKAATKARTRKPRVTKDPGRSPGINKAPGAFAKGFDKSGFKKGFHSGPSENKVKKVREKKVKVEPSHIELNANLAHDEHPEFIRAGFEELGLKVGQEK
jgi:hypothetical protein